jgi:hypothetical protein
MQNCKRFENHVSVKFEKVNLMRGTDGWREAQIDFIKWFCDWLDFTFTYSTKLVYKRWCVHGHLHEREEWTMLNVRCIAADQSVETSLSRYFKETELSQYNDWYENKTYLALCPECESLQEVHKRQTMLSNHLPELFVFQLRDTGVRFCLLIFSNYT